MQDFDWAAHTGAMFWPELEAYLYHSCCCALFFFLTSGQSETTRVVTLRFALGLDKHTVLLSQTLSAPRGEQSPQRDAAAQQKKPTNSQTEKQWNGTPVHRIVEMVRKNLKRIFTKPIKSVFSFLNNS